MPNDMKDVALSPKNNPYALTKQKKAFANEYIKDLNGRQAAIRAGYSPRSAQTISSALMNEVAVSQYVDSLLGDRCARTAIDADMVIRELAIVALSDISFFDFDADGYVVLREGAPDMALRSIKKIRRRVRWDGEGNKTIETEVELWDKPMALRMLGQHMGMFTQRHELTGPDGGPIQTEHIWKLGDREIKF